MCNTFRDIIRYFSAVASEDPVVETNTYIYIYIYIYVCVEKLYFIRIHIEHNLLRNINFYLGWRFNRVSVTVQR